MDLSKVFQVGADYKDNRTPTAWGMRLFAEVLFVDKTHPSAPSQVYQFKNAYTLAEGMIDLSKFNSASSSKDAFLLLGDMVSFDRKKKEILLKDQNIVNYVHLVIVSGRKPLLSFEDEEIASALQALNDALRVKAKIPSSFAPLVTVGSPAEGISPYTQMTAPEKPIVGNSRSSKHIERVVLPRISGAFSHESAFELDIVNRRLYEVQL
ncbi:MAG: hypothetical protein WCF65_08695 [Parachlamydiaceae bacterium]